jgi:hypothetical protein
MADKMTYTELTKHAERMAQQAEDARTAYAAINEAMKTAIDENAKLSSNLAFATKLIMENMNGTTIERLATFRLHQVERENRLLWGWLEEAIGRAEAPIDDKPEDDALRAAWHALEEHRKQQATPPTPSEQEEAMHQERLVGEGEKPSKAKEQPC